MTKQIDKTERDRKKLQDDRDKCNALLAALENWHGSKGGDPEFRDEKKYDLFLALMAFRRE